MKRVKKDWSIMAGEKIDVNQINNTLYGFGSELATLRLLKAYRYADKARQGYSENLGTFYFALDT